MADHMWYLSEERIGLSLFDDNVSHVIKDCMVKAMSEIDGNEKPPKRITVPLDTSAR